MSVKHIALMLAFLAASFANTASAQYAQPSPYAQAQYAQAQHTEFASGGYGVEAYADGGCNSCGGGDCGCGPHLHHWLSGFQGEGNLMIRGGALFLQREPARRTGLIYQTDDAATINDPAAISTHDLDINFQTGWEIEGRYNLGCGYGIEGRYFEVGGLNDQVNTNGTAVGYGVMPNDNNLFGIINGGVASTSLGSVAYDGEIRSAEANVRADFGRVQTLLGFRYVELKEDLAFSYTSTVSADFNNIFYRTENDLYGAQIGLEINALPEHYAFQIDCIGKVGVYYNDFKSQNSNVTNLGAVANGDNSLVGDTISAVGELNFLASYEMTRCLSVQCGAQLLWLNNVLEPSDQIAINPAPDNAGLVNYDASGTPFFIGIFTGLKYVH